MPTIAALLTVHNRREKTISCLACLYKQYGLGDIFDLDVFLTNDGCTDGTPEKVMELYPNVKIITGDGTLFWNRGMYKAWVEASRHTPDYYLWLNDDTLLKEDSLFRLFSISRDYGGNYVLVGSTCDSKTGMHITYGGKNSKGIFVFDWDKCQPCRFMNGNIVLIPDIVFQAVGYNDPFYRHSTGDTDYGLMVLGHGFELVVAPGFYGECDLHEKISDWCNPQVPFVARWKNMMSPLGANPFEFFYFKRKHFGFLPAIIIFVSNVIHVCFPRLWNNKSR